MQVAAQVSNVEELTQECIIGGDLVNPYIGAKQPTYSNPSTNSYINLEHIILKPHASQTLHPNDKDCNAVNTQPILIIRQRFFLQIIPISML